MGLTVAVRGRPATPAGRAIVGAFAGLVAYATGAVTTLVACALGAMTVPGVAAQEPRPAATWATAGAEIAIRVSPDGTAAVRLDYLFVPSQPGAVPPPSATIPLTVLGFGDVTVREVMVDGAPLVLWPTSGSRREAVVRPPVSSTDDAVPVTIEYRLPNAARIEGEDVALRVPLVTGPAPVDGGDGFTASLDVPEAWRMGDGFPSRLRPDDGGTWRATLPVVPSVVRLDGRTDGAMRVRLPLVVDIVTVGLLLAFALYGWRHLSGVVREARA